MGSVALEVLLASSVVLLAIVIPYFVLFMKRIGSTR